jgi:hypothetical protein
MTRDEHARFEELAAGHALNALEPGDEEAFLAHLSGCAVCERALVEHLETAAHLAYAADPVALPPALLGRIRAEVEASGRAMPETPTVSLDVARARLRPVLPRATLGAAAAAVLILALLTWNLTLQHDRSQTEQRADRLASAVRLLERGDRLVPLSDDSGRSVATAVMEGERKMSLVVDGLPANDRSSSTYVLWQTSATGARAVGAFDVRGDGVDVIRDMAVDTSFAGWNAFAVTREPGRTAPQSPGSSPVANGTLGA